MLKKTIAGLAIASAALTCISTTVYAEDIYKKGDKLLCPTKKYTTTYNQTIYQEIEVLSVDRSGSKPKLHVNIISEVSHGSQRTDINRTDVIPMADFFSSGGSQKCLREVQDGNEINSSSNLWGTHNKNLKFSVGNAIGCRDQFGILSKVYADGAGSISIFLDGKEEISEGREIRPFKTGEVFYGNVSYASCHIGRNLSVTEFPVKDSSGHRTMNPGELVSCSNESLFGTIQDAYTTSTNNGVVLRIAVRAERDFSQTEPAFTIEDNSSVRHVLVDADECQTLDRTKKILIEGLKGPKGKR